MKAFITGSTGLLGSNLTRLLLDEGYEVKALARSAQKARSILGSHPKLKIISGDMEAVEGFANELSGCDVLFHVAAYFREYAGSGDHWSQLKKINVDGTIQILNAAEQRGIQNTIYVSSAELIGRLPDGAQGDESTPPGARVETNLYIKSKILAESAIAEWLKQHKMRVVLILPTAMVGPFDAAPTQMGKAIIDLQRRAYPAMLPGGFPFVDARDVAQAMINAVELGRSGERYIINEKFHTMAEVAAVLERITGVPAPRRHISLPVATFVARAAELNARLRGTTPRLTMQAVRLLQDLGDVSSAKAIHELKITLRPFEETLRDEVRWFKENGYLDAAKAG